MAKGKLIHGALSMLKWVGFERTLFLTLRKLYNWLDDLKCVSSLISQH